MMNKAMKRKNYQSIFLQVAMFLHLAFLTTTAWAQQDMIVTGYYAISGTQGRNNSEQFTMLVDGDKTTQWCVTERDLPFFVEFNSTEAFVPTGYVMTTGSDNAIYAGRNPLSWVIKAKVNLTDTEWTTISTVENDAILQDENTTDYEFPITNSTRTAYKFFRMEVSAVHSGDSKPIFQMAELQFRGYTYEFVNLGLPSGTLWATCNIGANSPEEYGDYFAWGETKTKANFYADNYQYFEGTNYWITKYCTNSSFGDVDNKTELEPMDDAATANWGSDWQMPSGEQFEELIDTNYTTTEWTALNGVNGRLVTSKVNGDSIFLPAGGYFNWYFREIGSFGHYWSRSLYENHWGSNGKGLYFYREELLRDFCGRQYGRSVRPVRVQDVQYLENRVELSSLTGDYIVQDGEVLTGTLNGNYKISIADGATITLYNVTINGVDNGNNIWAGITCLGDATIILANGTINTVEGFCRYYPAIYVPQEKTLTIRGNGILNATGGDNSAAIGGGYGGTCGNITISDGIVIATGGNNSPGIGSGTNDNTNGHDASCGNITITNDVTYVIAKKGSSTAPTSIGAGSDGATCGTVTIGGDIYPDGITSSPYTFIPERNVILADGIAYPYEEDYDANTATYTKTLGSDRVGRFQAWFVPFDYIITAADIEKFYFYKINMIANALTPGEGEVTDDIWVFLTRIGEGSVLSANMPYVYKPKEAIPNYEFTSSNVTLKAPETGVLLTMQTAEDIYTIYGTYANTTPAASDPFYYISYYGRINLGNSGTLTVGPYRWIMRKVNKYGDATNYAPEMHFFDDMEDPTSIHNIQYANHNEAEAWYSLDGVRLTTKPNAKGIYIHNKRKEIIQ